MTTPTSDWGPTEARPVYSMTKQELNGAQATQLYMVEVNEGWRSSIMCTGMYEWAARWLIEQLQGKPFAPGVRP